MGSRQHGSGTGLCFLLCGLCKGTGWCWVLPLQNFRGAPRFGPNQLLIAGLGMSKRVSLTQREGWQLCMADVTDIHPGAYLDPDMPEGFAVPAGLPSFIPDVTVCHSREQASWGVCRELHPSEDAAWRQEGHSSCSQH